MINEREADALVMAMGLRAAGCYEDAGDAYYDAGEYYMARALYQRSLSVAVKDKTRMRRLEVKIKKTRQTQIDYKF